jgi:hypothetical protein
VEAGRRIALHNIVVCHRLFALLECGAALCLVCRTPVWGNVHVAYVMPTEADFVSDVLWKLAGGVRRPPGPRP